MNVHKKKNYKSIFPIISSIVNEILGEKLRENFFSGGKCMNGWKINHEKLFFYFTLKINFC